MGYVKSPGEGEGAPFSGDFEALCDRMGLAVERRLGLRGREGEVEVG